MEREATEEGKRIFLSSLVHFLLYLDVEDKKSISAGKLLAAATGTYISSTDHHSWYFFPPQNLNQCPR